MAKGNFGERLKREREMREVSLEELTKATRISTRFLLALENEDWEKLPGGVFGHGFVRTIARYLGLDEESLLGEYDMARGGQVLAEPAKPEERIPSPPKWLPVAAVFVVLLVVIALFYAGRYGWRRYAAHRAAKQSAVSSSPPQSGAQNTSSHWRRHGGEFLAGSFGFHFCCHAHTCHVGWQALARYGAARRRDAPLLCRTAI
jgi:cytoskeletal protein RodZ